MYVSVFKYILSISSIFLIIFVQQIFVRIYDLSFITLHIYMGVHTIFLIKFLKL